MYKISRNFRFTLLALELLSQSAKRMGLTKTAVIEQAVRAYAASVLSPRKIREIEKHVEEHEDIVAYEAEQEEMQEELNQSEEEEEEELEEA